MDDRELGERLVKALRAISDSRLPNGNPIRGKLRSLTVNITPDRWQAIVQYWFANHWNVVCEQDPAIALMKVLEMEPDLSEGYDPAKWLKAAKPVLDGEYVNWVVEKPQPEPVQDDANDLSDLLV